MEEKKTPPDRSTLRRSGRFRKPSQKVQQIDVKVKDEPVKPSGKTPGKDLCIAVSALKGSENKSIEIACELVKRVNGEKTIRLALDGLKAGQLPARVPDNFFVNSDKFDLSADKYELKITTKDVSPVSSEPPPAKRRRLESTSTNSNTLNFVIFDKNELILKSGTYGMVFTALEEHEVMHQTGDGKQTFTRFMNSMADLKIDVAWVKKEAPEKRSLQKGPTKGRGRPNITKVKPEKIFPVSDAYYSSKKPQLINDVKSHSDSEAEDIPNLEHLELTPQEKFESKWNEFLLRTG